MKQFKLLIAFIFLFTQNVYTYEGFDGSADASSSVDASAPKDSTCTSTIDQISSELHLVQVGAEKDKEKLFAAQNKVTKLNGLISCLRAEKVDVESVSAELDLAGSNINHQIAVAYSLSTTPESTEPEKQSKSVVSTDDAGVKKIASDKKEPQVSAPTANPATKEVPLAPASASSSTSAPPLAATEPRAAAPATNPTTPVPSTETPPVAAAVGKEEPKPASPAATVSPTINTPPVPTPTASPAINAALTATEQKEKSAPVVTADPTKKITDVATTATPVKPAASSDINIGAIAKIGLMAAAAWIYVKELTKAFKKKDEDNSANRSTASSGSGSSSSSSNPSGTKAVAGGKGCTGTFVGTIDAPSHAERIKARNIKLNNMGYQLTGNDYEDNGATGGGGVDGGMYLTGSFSFETDANCKVISGQAIIFGSPFDISGTVNQNRTFNLSYLGPMPGVITADNKISGKLQHGGGEEYIHGVLNGRFTPKK